MLSVKWQSNSYDFFLSLHVFLLHSIPFSVEDISSSFQPSDFSAVKPAAELLQNPDFQFLQDWRHFAGLSKSQKASRVDIQARGHCKNQPLFIYVFSFNFLSCEVLI